MTNPVLEGVPLYAYGHSYLALSHFGATAEQRYINRVGRRLAMNVVNRATGGWFMQDAAVDAIGTRRPWAVGTHGVVVLDATTNNVLHAKGSAADLRGFEHGLRAFLQYVSLDYKLNEDHGLIRRSSGYLSAHPDFCSGQSWRLKPGQSGNATLATVSWERVVVGVGGHDGGSGGVFDVVVDGVVRATVDTNYQTVQTKYGGRRFVPIAVPLELGVGNHTIQVRPAGNAAASGSGPLFEYVARPAATPPRVVVMRGVYLPSYPEGVSDATYDAYNAIIDSVAAEFANVAVCDAAVGWDPATMVGSDGIHANGRGHAHLAGALEAAIGAAVTDFSVGVTR